MTDTATDDTTTPMTEWEYQLWSECERLEDQLKALKLQMYRAKRLAKQKGYSEGWLAGTKQAVDEGWTATPYGNGGTIYGPPDD